MTTILVDGAEADCVPALDRGLAYGDGLFETVAVRDGEPRHLERHLARLARGCDRLGLPRPDAAVLHAEMHALARAAGRGVLKLLYTRGVGGRGYRPPERGRPLRVLAMHPPPVQDPEHATRGVRVAVCRTRLAVNPVLAGIKHLNRLEQVLASRELDDTTAEGLMLDSDDRLIEGTRTNVFLVLDDVLVTPDLSRCGVAGIMRELVLERAAALGIPVRVADVPARALDEASELFLCNSLLGVWPVRAVAGRRAALPAPGTLTLRLAEALAADGAL